MSRKNNINLFFGRGKFLETVSQPEFLETVGQSDEQATVKRIQVYFATVTERHSFSTSNVFHDFW